MNCKCPICKRPGGQRINEDPITGEYDEVPCKTCQQEIAEAKRAQRLKELPTLLRHSGVPKMFWNAKLEDFTNPVQEVSTYLWGGPGVGKTHMMIALLRERLLRGLHAVFTSETNMNESLKQFQENNLQRLAHCSVLFIDDVGVAKQTEWTLQNMEHLVDVRYAEERPLMITTNHSPASFAQIYGDRIASRVFGMCKVVEMTGKDRRQR